MFKVDPVTQQEIDSWTIAESGLPTRVVNGTAEAGMRLVGDLRDKTDAELLALRTIGRVSLADVRKFFELGDRIQRGRQFFLTIQEVFDLFLDKEEMTVLAARYGLNRPDMGMSRNYLKLQEIGNDMQRTRERVRQVEAIAGQKLRSRLAVTCFQPFYLYIRAFIQQRGGAVSQEEIGDLNGQSWLSGYNPCCIALLLHDLNPEKLTEHNGFFSTLPEKSLRALEERLIEALKQRGRIVPLDEILQSIPSAPEIPSRPALMQVAATLLDHCYPVGATRDGRYFVFESGVESYVLEVLRKLARPAHYRQIASAFNDGLKPASRRGSGFMLKLLNQMSQCVKVDRGRYDLAPGA